MRWKKYKNHEKKKRKSKLNEKFSKKSRGNFFEHEKKIGVGKKLRYSFESEK